MRRPACLPAFSPCRLAPPAGASGLRALSSDCCCPLTPFPSPNISVNDALRWRPRSAYPGPSTTQWGSSSWRAPRSRWGEARGWRGGLHARARARSQLVLAPARIPGASPCPLLQRRLAKPFVKPLLPASQVAVNYSQTFAWGVMNGGRSTRPSTRLPIHPQEWFEAHKRWLVPYATFCFLRDLFGTAEHWRWGAMATPTPELLERLTGGRSGLEAAGWGQASRSSPWPAPT